GVTIASLEVGNPSSGRLPLSSAGGGPRACGSSEFDAELLGEGAEFLLFLAHLLFPVEELHRLLLDDLHPVLDVLLPLFHRGAGRATELLHVGDFRTKAFHLRRELRRLRVEFEAVRLDGSLLTFQDFLARIEASLTLRDLRVARAELLFLVQHIEGFLLKEPEVLRDLGLHSVRLGSEALRLPPERLRLVACGEADATVLLNLCALRIYLVPRSFEGSDPVSEFGFLRRMTDGPFRHLRLRGPDRVLPRADFALFLREVFHQIFGSLHFLGELLVLCYHL